MIVLILDGGRIGNIISNLITLAVYKDNKDGFPTTEESHSKQRAYIAFKISHKKAMNERDGINFPAPALVESYPIPPGQKVLRVK